jgi:hypothetical protein
MEVPEAVRRLERDLRDLFGERVRSLVTYAAAVDEGGGQPTLAVVDRLTADDLGRAATRITLWHHAGLDTPLILTADEFARALDAFPLEFGAILDSHVLVAGADPFAGLRVHAADLRRACETQARSHLLHLREGYLEAGGRGDERLTTHIDEWRGT